MKCNVLIGTGIPPFAKFSLNDSQLAGRTAHSVSRAELGNHSKLRRAPSGGRGRLPPPRHRLPLEWGLKTCPLEGSLKGAPGTGALSKAAPLQQRTGVAARWRGGGQRPARARSHLGGGLQNVRAGLLVAGRGRCCQRCCFSRCSESAPAMAPEASQGRLGTHGRWCWRPRSTAAGGSPSLGAAGADRGEWQCSDTAAASEAQRQQVGRCSQKPAVTRARRPGRGRRQQPGLLWPKRPRQGGCPGTGSASGVGKAQPNCSLTQRGPNRLPSTRSRGLGRKRIFPARCWEASGARTKRPFLEGMLLRLCARTRGCPASRHSSWENAMEASGLGPLRA